MCATIDWSFIFILRDYIGINNVNYTTETLSRDDIFLSDANCQCHLTTCARLTLSDINGVVCVDYINNSLVRQLRICLICLVY